MALKYEIKNFHKEGEKQHVGMTITDDNGHTFLIDKQVDYQEGRTDEEYINDALVLMESEIEEWENSYKVIGKEFDVVNKKFKE